MQKLVGHYIFVDQQVSDQWYLELNFKPMVKAKLTSAGAIPSEMLSDLLVANKQKARLQMRRIAILIESGNTTGHLSIDCC